MVEDGDFGSKFTAGMWGVWAGVAATSIDYNLGLGLFWTLLIAYWAYQFKLYDKLADRYGESLKEMMNTLEDRFLGLIDWTLRATEGYGKYAIGGFFIYCIAVLLLIPDIPYRWFHLAIVVLAAVDWYVFKCRYLRSLYWRLHYKPGLIVTAVLIAAAYLYGAGQLQPLLENYLEFLQRGVSQ